MEIKYVRAIKTLKRIAKSDPSIRSVVEEIEKNFDTKREEALALAACILLNYKKDFTIETVEADFKDLGLTTIDIIAIIELLKDQLFID
jgi:hypothetical protein